MKKLLIFLLATIPSLAFSENLTHEDLRKVETAWEKVDPFGAGSRLSLSIDDCTMHFRRSPAGSCEDGGTLRMSEQVIDLREVSAIQSLVQETRPHIRFHYRVPKPNRLEALANHLPKPIEEAFQDYTEASDDLLEGAKLTSGKRQIRCDGSETTQSKRHTLIFVAKRPEHWSMFRSLASQCGVANFE
ncbi:hypothetical protein [Leisingera sp. JC11]|uniref:hypothetical protein n=1 Tax=Leisingera sp. JC11 TaxID=3042469 RepID=UPI0034546197